MDKQVAQRLCEHRLREEELDAEFAHLAEERAKLAEFKQLHEQMGQIAAEAAEANRELDRKEAELRAADRPHGMQRDLSRENYRKLIALVDDYAWHDAPQRQIQSGEDDDACFLRLSAGGQLQAEIYVNKSLLL